MHPAGEGSRAFPMSEVRDSLATVSTVTEGNSARHRGPRSLPPWIDSYETRYGVASDDQLQLLNPPSRAVRPQHNNTPGELERRVSKDGFIDLHDPRLDGSQRKSRFPPILKRHRPERGRKWDHLRTAEPVIVPGHARRTEDPSKAWREFVHSSVYGHMPNEESEVVGVEVLDQLQPTFNKDVDLPAHPLDPAVSRRRRTLALYQRVWRIIIHHPFSPLVFRMTVIVTSLIALGISARIYELDRDNDLQVAERSQSVVAVVVDTVAIPYVGYMIWDEYTGKPIGLRRAIQKISLILMDLFFIIFKSASTTLAFEALVYHNATDELGRDLARALASFMLVGLLSWTMTFIVNVFRTVERLGGGEDEARR